MTRYKVRIRFAKSGDLRFLSHHDLMRLFERMMRRAGLPFRSTAGFHPKPKMAFASALGLGIVGWQEVVEIELAEECPVDEIRQRLAAQALPGLEIISVRVIAANLKAQPRRVCYRLSTDAAQTPEVSARIDELMTRTECWVERTRPHSRKVDIRPFIERISADSSGLEMQFLITPHGSARPEEVLKFLELDHLLTDGAVLERTSLELEDEINDHEASGVSQRAEAATPAVAAPASLQEGML